MTVNSASDKAPFSHLDHSVLETLQNQLPGRPDIIFRFLTSFLRHSPGMLDKVRSAIQLGDPEALYRAAHTMKSSTGQIGARKLTAMCQELELLGNIGELLDADQLLVDLEEEYRGVEAELKLLLDQNQQPVRM